MESRYKIEWQTDGYGFVVYGRNPTAVRLMANKPALTVVDLSAKPSYYERAEGYFNFHNIMKTVSYTVMKNWKGPEQKESKSSKFRNREAVIKNWAVTQCSKALGKKVRDSWRLLLEKAPAEQVNVQRKIFAAIGNTPDVALQTSFYENAYFIRDIQKYRAAALTTPHYHGGVWIPDALRIYTDSNYQKEIDNWMSFYSGTNQPYTSLNRTLMSLPGNIPHWMAKDFRRFHFERPITNRIELIALLSSRFDRHTHIFMHATEKQLRRAISLYAESQREKPNFRKASYIKSVIESFCDYPEPHNGNVVGLAEKSIRYHRELGYANLKNYSNIPLDTLTAKPPVPLPEDERIRFLENVAEVIERGLNQKHCVGGYAQQAVNGNCYLFSIEYDGEQATAEVSPDGIVSQIKGPHNSSNKATAWGRQRLTKWGKALQNSLCLVGAGTEEMRF